MNTNMYGRNTLRPNRKSIRLKNYDYSSNGAYFITICTQDREYLFGDIKNGKMILNNIGLAVNHAIQETPNIRQNVQIDIYQIMPNHIHIIIVITDRIHGVGAYCNTPLQSDNTPHRTGELNSPQGVCNTPLRFKSPSQTLGSIIRGIKSVTTKQIRIITNNPQFPIWQRNYYEHVIRNEIELYKIQEYIMLNPQMWERDRNNPQAKKDLTPY